ncbi:hypothetical protein UK23_44035 [Lentzea aerocolonigenes]|uniref:Uncharacterized protein n=1 Tax=Lentzea aerocolonigenes TaxID=68170 RepID=A0A0F0GC41_LENAE|nr:hypothetical protein UK23_44035 [Lentzea aerocolonigenes]
MIMAQNGMWGYYGAVPAARAAQPPGSRWNGFALMGAAIGSLVLAIVVYTRRRKATAGERE